MRTPLIVIFCVLAGTTLLTCGVIMTINPKLDDVVLGLSTISTVLSFLLYYFGMIGCIIGIILIIAIRFYKTCYTDQGYLTHTLPVTAVQLLAAKIITAILSYLLVLIGIIVTIVILIAVFGSHMITITGSDMSFGKIIHDLLKELNDSFEHNIGVSFTGYIIFMIFYGLVSCITNVITILGCVSLGQLYAKHRIIGAILAYFAVIMIQQIIGCISIIPTYTNLFAASEMGKEILMADAFSPNLIVSLVSCIVIAIAMYFANLHMMTKRLNLE